MALRVTFWGTRGSIPVSLDCASLRDKLASAVVAASGEGSTRRKKRAPGSTAKLDFAVSHTFGGNSACVQLEAGDGDT